MNKKFLAMGGIALVFGGAGLAAADYWLKANVKTVVKEVVVEKPITEMESMPTIVVAAEPFTYGDDVTADRLREVPWAAGDLPQGAFAKIDDMLSDGSRAALAPMEVGEPILATRVTGPDGRPTLSAKLTPGMRAMTIRVDDISGVAGFVVPEDRVDIVLTRTFDIKKPKGEEESAGASPARLTTDENGSLQAEGNQFAVTTPLMENVKVLSIDQIADERQANPVVVRTVTIEILPEQARLVATAQAAGTLSLQLRKAGEAGDLPVAAMPTQSSIDYATTSSWQRPEPKVEPVAAPDPVFEPAAPRKPTVVVRHGDQVQSYDVTAEGAR